MTRGRSSIDRVFHCTKRFLPNSFGAAAGMILGLQYAQGPKFATMYTCLGDTRQPISNIRTPPIPC